MRVLAFRHVPFEGAGLIRPALEARGISLEYVDLYQPGAVLPSTDEFDGLVFMGGPMSVNDPLPYLQWEMDAIRGAVQRNQPVLGICLGSQLILGQNSPEAHAGKRSTEHNHEDHRAYQDRTHGTL